MNMSRAQSTITVPIFLAVRDGSIRVHLERHLVPVPVVVGGARPHDRNANAGREPRDGNGFHREERHLAAAASMSERVLDARPMRNALGQRRDAGGDAARRQLTDGLLYLADVLPGQVVQEVRMPLPPELAARVLGVRPLELHVDEAIAGGIFRGLRPDRRPRVLPEVERAEIDQERDPRRKARFADHHALCSGHEKLVN